jgi:hypothetical protein
MCRSLNGALCLEGLKKSDVSMSLNLQNRKRHAGGWMAAPPPKIKSDAVFLVSQKRENIIDTSIRLGVTHL